MSEAIDIDRNAVAVITGGAGGMGMAAARRFAKRHALLLMDIDAQGLDSFASDLRDQGYVVTCQVGDVSRPEDVAMLAETVRGLGKFRALVHTAGLSPSMADGLRIMQVNLAGTVLIAEALLPLAERGTAAVLIASSAGHQCPFGDQYDAVMSDALTSDFLERMKPGATESSNAYFLSKRGVLRYCERACVDWGKRGARITTISPGMIKTPMGELEFGNQPLMRELLEQTPLGGRWADADEIASVAEFLCSDGASFITGTDVQVDGGVTKAWRPPAVQ